MMRKEKREKEIAIVIARERRNKMEIEEKEILTEEESIRE